MNFTVNLTEIILAVISLLGGIALKFVIPLIKAKTSEKTYSIILCACETAVYFAEQWYKCDDGEVKKQHALEYVQNELAARGITVDMALVNDCIEAEVKKLKLAMQYAEPTED